MAFVYWIHLEKHNDMLTEGYVGVCKNAVLSRYSRHLRDSKNGSEYPIHRAIEKYTNQIIVTTIIEGDLEYCYLIEGKLRSSKNIGWNIQKGGHIAPMTDKKHKEESLCLFSRVKKHSDISRQKMSEAHKFRKKRTKKWCTRHKGNMWATKAALKEDNKKAWKIADEVFNIISSSIITNYAVSKLLNVPASAIKSIRNCISRGWNPTLDSEWLIFKTLRE